MLPAGAYCEIQGRLWMCGGFADLALELSLGRGWSYAARHLLQGIKTLTSVLLDLLRNKAWVSCSDSFLLLGVEELDGQSKQTATTLPQIWHRPWRKGILGFFLHAILWCGIRRRAILSAIFTLLELIFLATLEWAIFTLLELLFLATLELIFWIDFSSDTWIDFSSLNFELIFLASIQVKI